MGIQEVLYIPVAAWQERLSFVMTDPIDWKTFVLVSSWAVYAFDTYLTFRQYPLYSKPNPPPILAHHFPAEKFSKSQLYGKDKAKFNLISSLYRQVLETLLIVYGFYATAWEWAGAFISLGGFDSSYEILQSIMFVTIAVLASSIPTLPLSVYSTFVLEEKHGFNKTTISIFITDILKGWLVGFVIGAPFMAAFLYVFQWAGDHFVPWLMAFLLGFQMLMVFLYPTVIQPLFNKLTPLRPGEVKDRVEALASRLNFPLKHLYEIDGSKRSGHSNAYFFGLPWSKHIVIYDTLLTQAKPEEVEAILAHELGHWYYSHPTKLLALSQIHTLALIASFPAFLKSTPLLLSFDFPTTVAVHPPTMIAFLLYQQILTPLESVITLVMNSFSRRFEYQADRFACEIDEHHAVPGQEKGDMGQRLSSALIIIHVENLATVWVDWLNSAYHHSHPTLTERLKALADYSSKSIQKKNH